MKKLMKGAAISVLGLGLALGVAAQADAMPGYTQDNNPYDDTCKSCHATDPYATTGDTGDSNTGDSNTGDSNTGDSNTGDSNTGDSNTGDSNTGDSATLPQTGAEGIYLNYLAGAGLLVPGAALLAARKKQH